MKISFGQHDQRYDDCAVYIRSRSSMRSEESHHIKFSRSTSLGLIDFNVSVRNRNFIDKKKNADQ